MENLKALRIQNSKLLLLEMPMTCWTEYMIRELTELAGKGGIQIVLAHVERYLKLQKKSTWERLLESGILMQSNASFFLGFGSKKKAISLLKKGKINFSFWLKCLRTTVLSTISTFKSFLRITLFIKMDKMG